MSPLRQLLGRIGLAFAVGAVLLSGWMTALALAGIHWQPIVLVVLAGAAAYLLRFVLPAESVIAEAPESSRATGLTAAPAVAAISRQSR